MRAWKTLARRVVYSYLPWMEVAVEEGEDPLAGAKRELLEETGYAADDWRALGTWVVDGNYGVCSEHAFVARGARRVNEPDHGDLEEIAVELHTVDEVRTALRSGDVAQLSAAAALGVALALSAR